MSADPVKELIGELGTRLLQKEHSDTVFSRGRGSQFEIKPSEFVEIAKNDTPRKIAFVDGGNGILYETPNTMIIINRVYFSIFEGKRRTRPKSNPRIQFFSLVISSIHTENGKRKIQHDTRLFTYNKDDNHLPLESDLMSQTETSYVMQGDKINSMGRRFAEWQMASHVVEKELEPGDMIVMDGSLQTSFKNEAKYAKRLYDTAMDKNVTVCGLAKTSKLVTESGDPLMSRISEIAEDVPFGRWYVKVAEEVSSDDRGFMLAAKFHEKSSYVFRFEILRDQFVKMELQEINSILSSLAANSQDMAMIGYPYGALDADRFAQVRMDEIDMYRRLVIAEMFKNQEWKRLQKYDTGLGAHDTLNEVTS